MTFQLRIMTRELTSILGSCARVIDKGSKIPILRSVLISATGTRVQVIATNTEQTVIAAAACDGTGEICVDGASLETKIRALRQSDPVEIVEDGENSVTIKQGRTRWKLPTLAARDYPRSVSDIIEGDGIVVGPEFFEAVRTAKIGVNPADPRGAVAGIHLSKSVTGADGKVIFMVDAGIECDPITIPVKFIDAMDAMTGPAKLVATERSVQISTEWITIKTQAIEGNYPNVRAIVDAISADGEFVVDREEILAAVNRASLIRADGEKTGSYVATIMKIRDGEIEFATSNRDGEEGSDYASCSRSSGGDVDIRFAGDLLVRGLSSFSCETIAIRYSDHMSPIVMSPINSARENIRVVMPRRA